MKINPFDELLAKQQSARFDKTKELISFGLLGFIAACMGVAIWSLFKPADLAYQSLPWEIAGEERAFKPGQVVPLKVTRCNSLKRPLIYTVTRGLKNLDTEATQVFPSVQVVAEPGCKASISQLHVLPKDLKPGTYIVTGVGTIPDVLNEKTIAFQSKPFTVVSD